MKFLMDSGGDVEFVLIDGINLAALQQCQYLLKRIELVESEAAQSKEQLLTRQRELSEVQKQKEAQEARLEDFAVEVAQLKEQLAARQYELEELKLEKEQQVERLKELEAKIAQLHLALQPQEWWQIRLEQEKQALITQRASFDAKIEKSAAMLRELDVLRAECTRRYSAIQELSAEVSQLKEQLVRSQAYEQEVYGLRQQLESLSAAPMATADILALKQQLQEARDESDLLQLQLQQQQEKLEYYYLLSLNQPMLADCQKIANSATAVYPQFSQPETAAINGFRQHLLATY